MASRSNARARKQVAEGDIKASLADLREDLEQLAKTVKSRGDGMSEEAQTWASDQLHALRERIDDMIGTAREQGDAAIEAARDKIQTHPFASVLSAFAVGMVLSQFIFRRR